MTLNSFLSFIKIFQNTLQLCWGDEWPTLSPGRQPGRASGPEAAAGYFTSKSLNNQVDLSYLRCSKKSGVSSTFVVTTQLLIGLTG
jgi:hypothetical protein